VRALAGPEGEGSDGAPGTGLNAVAEFFTRAPQRLAALRKLVAEIGGASEIAVRQKLLGDLCDQVRALKGEAGVPELLPAWQMTSALEGLLKQLTDKVSNVTASTLQTVAAGVDLLGELCRPGVRADICANPPFRLLAVDDELISRHALSSALKRGLNQPDLAENAEGALALAAQRLYDVIFLDIQMPGMDGFDLCSRIHEATANRTTPVVFVSGQSDFNARARSVLCGGNDLIGKPFLTFEVTVKALTLVLRARLQQPVPASGQLPATTAEALATAGLTGGTDTNRLAAVTRPTQVLTVPGAAAEDPQGLVSAFAGRATALLPRVRELIKLAGEAQPGDARQEMLGDLYCSVTSLAPPVDGARLGPAGRLTVALESLLRKLLQHPENTTPSTFQTLAAAVDLLGDLCALGPSACLASGPPIHLLVVDDDPLARRALAGGLQLVFGQPDTAADGEAAVALAAQKAFDVIFMDVQMPGMDGFAACSKIRETPANRHTPVVFVTNHNREETRRAAFQSGGNEFITKPFLCSELTLKALTFALRARLDGGQG
jgi:CheY-like chemotaxis protein